MRKPVLTFDAILAAVAVLSAGASACSKSDRATAEPPAEAPAAPLAAPPPAPAPAPEPVTAAATARPEGTAAVDAGTDVSPRRGREAPKGSGDQAACGATGCSADMRKGGK